MDPSAARAVLGLAPAADLQQVEQAFRVAAQRAHPDHGGDPEGFRRAVVARDVLRRQLGVGSSLEPTVRAPVIVVPDRSPIRRLIDGFDRRSRPPRVI